MDNLLFLLSLFVMAHFLHPVNLFGPLAIITADRYLGGNMKKHSGLFAAGLLACVTAGTSQASLIDLGNGLVYDDVLDISWLQNANLAATETFGVAGINVDGTMTWHTAAAWIAAMNANNYLGYSTWQLPSVSPLNGVNFNYAPIHDGSHDRGYNISETGTLYEGSTAHQLAHLFYNSLGNDALCVPSAATNDEGCLSRATPDYYAPWGLANTGPFSNLIGYRYWYKQQSEENETRYFDFNFNDGQTGTGYFGNPFHVLPILAGDATAVPVPGAVWLLGSGLLGLVAIGRRRSA